MRSLVREILDAFGINDGLPELLNAYGLSSFSGGEDQSVRRRRRLFFAVLRGALGEIKAAFGAEIPFILLKGEPLETLLFGAEYERSTGDIDLLILPGDLDLARHRLAALDYARVSDEEPRMWAHNQEAWQHQTLGVMVELHWSLAEPGVPQPSVVELFETRETFRFSDDLEVDFLRADYLFLHLVLHFHHHMGFAKGLLDIAGWCERFGDSIDQEALLARARQLKMYGLVQWPLHTIQHLIGIRPPMCSTDYTAKIWGRISAEAMRDCLRRPPRNEVEASLVAVMPTAGPMIIVPLKALTMLTVDGKSEKARAFWRPILQGPHFVGRGMRRLGFFP